LACPRQPQPPGRFPLGSLRLRSADLRALAVRRPGTAGGSGLLGPAPLPGSRRRRSSFFRNTRPAPMSGGPGQFLTALTSRPGAFYCRCGVGGVSYYHGKKDHHKRVTTERPHPTGGAPHPAGVGPPPGRTRKGEVDSDSLFRVFRWIPWLISDFRDLYASLIRRWLDVDPTPILGERKATMILVSTRASARRGRTITTTREAKRESRSAQFSRRV